MIVANEDTHLGRDICRWLRQRDAGIVPHHGCFSQSPCRRGKMTAWGVNTISPIPESKGANQDAYPFPVANVERQSRINRKYHAGAACGELILLGDRVSGKMNKGVSRCQASFIEGR